MDWLLAGLFIAYVMFGVIAFGHCANNERLGNMEKGLYCPGCVFAWPLYGSFVYWSPDEEREPETQNLEKKETDSEYRDSRTKSERKPQ